MRAYFIGLFTGLIIAYTMMLFFFPDGSRNETGSTIVINDDIAFADDISRRDNANGDKKIKNNNKLSDDKDGEDDEDDHDVSNDDAKRIDILDKTIEELEEVHHESSEKRINDLGRKGTVVQLINVPGILPGSYRSKDENKKISSPLDLPQIFPIDPQTFQSTQGTNAKASTSGAASSSDNDENDDNDDGKPGEKQKVLVKNDRIRVCLFNRTPRQRSLFATNVISMFGSGKYEYVSMDSTDCQHYGTCPNAKEARKHPECDPAINPTVYLLERIKCCQHERFDKVLERAKEFWDVVVASGDEYCRATSAYSKAHYRMYYGPNVVAPETLVTSQDIGGAAYNSNNNNNNSSALSKIPWWERANGAPLKDAPLYLPLGPREEFRRVKPKHVIPVGDRKYLFNFVGSLTSRSRMKLKKELLNLHIPNTVSFTHITEEWSKEITQKNGYILPSEYRRVVMNSTFTLCPQGHNPEAYRIFEACEAGSIPIVVLDASYQVHECRHSFLPLVEAGAPIVFLNGWKGLGAFLKKVVNNKNLLQKMQINVMEWYSKYMQAVANEFENKLTKRFQERLANGNR